MKNYMKIGSLVGVLSILLASTVIAGLPNEKSNAKTLTDYLIDKDVSFLIVNSGESSKLTTFGWWPAKKGCQDIKTAGFNIMMLQNYEEETLDETFVSCN